MSLFSIRIEKLFFSKKPQKYYILNYDKNQKKKTKGTTLFFATQI